MERHLTEENVDSLALGVASDEETARWRAHLAECPECRRTFQAAMDALDAVEEIVIPKMQPDRWERLTRESLKSGRPATQRRTIQTHRRLAFSLGGWAWRLAALAAAFIIGFVVGGVRRDDPWQSLALSTDRSPRGIGSTRDLAQGPPPAVSTTSTASQTLSADAPEVSADDCETIRTIRSERFPHAVPSSQERATQQVPRHERDSC